MITPAVTVMDNPVVDAAMARARPADATREHALVAWVIMRNPPEHPGVFTGRRVMRHQSPTVLTADTLAGLQEQLPASLLRSARQPSDPPGVVEIWCEFSGLM